MYADDIILLSSSARGLQRKLDILNQYSKEWCLRVNTNKTKIITFNKAGKLLNFDFILDFGYHSFISFPELQRITNT